MPTLHSQTRPPTVASSNLTNHDVTRLSHQLDRLALAIGEINQALKETKDRQVTFENETNRRLEQQRLQHQQSLQQITASFNEQLATFQAHTINQLGSLQPHGSMPTTPGLSLKPSPEIQTRGTDSVPGCLAQSLLGNVEEPTRSPSRPGVDMDVATQPVRGGNLDQVWDLKEEGYTQQQPIPSQSSPSQPPFAVSSNHQPWYTPIHYPVSSNHQPHEPIQPVVSSYQPVGPTSSHTPVQSAMPSTSQHPVPMEEPSHHTRLQPQKKPSMYSNMNGTSPLQRMLASDHIALSGTGLSDDNPQGHDNGGPRDPDAISSGSGGVSRTKTRGKAPKGSKYFYAKPDATAYPTLISNKYFDKWYERFIATARAQGMYMVFDPDYVSKTFTSSAELVRMNQWLYAVFQTTVQTTTGKAIVKSHFHECDCFNILIELFLDAKASVVGSLDHVETINWLSSIQYNPGKSPAVDFIIEFDTKVTQYNDGQFTAGDRLTDSMKKLFLQRAFTHIHVLNDVRAREYERICSKGPQESFHYEEYKEALLDAAAFYDVSNSASMADHDRPVHGEQDDQSTPDFRSGD